MSEYIQLKRQFSPFASNNDPERKRDYWRNRNNTLGWGELLKKDKVVILAEAGTGKTDEFKAMAQQLHDEGKAAFFCRIEYLLESDFDFDDADIGGNEDFKRWQASDNLTGYFFLDSVDEAKLKDSGAFRLAVKRFSKKIRKGNYQRAKVFVSSRFSEWDAKDDLNHFSDRFNLSEDNKKSCVYTLEALTEEQIIEFATEKKVTNAQAFIDAVEHSGMQLFASRPQDLLDLITYWKDKNTFGRHIEMLEYSIKEKLREKLDEPSRKKHALCDKQIEKGVRCLAAATTFLQKNKIQLTSYKKEKEDALDPLSILPKEKPTNIDKLLTLRVFDNPIYSAVRFHHRSVREFLTAQWLDHLLKEGVSQHKIEALLIKEQYGQLVVIPSMRAIAAWLACWDENIRHKLMRIAPKVLIEFGDPSTFPLAFRMELLDVLIKRYKDQQHSDLQIDPILIKNFATDMVADEIKPRLQENATHHDLCYLLLSIILHGQIKGLATEANEIALSNTFSKKFSSSIRDIAFRIVLATGSQQQKRHLIKQLLAQGGEGQRVVSYSSGSLLHEILVVDELIEFINNDQYARNKRDGLILDYWDKIIRWLEESESDSKRKQRVFKFLIRLYKKDDLEEEEVDQLRQLAASQSALAVFQKKLKPPLLIEEKEQEEKKEKSRLIYPYEICETFRIEVDEKEKIKQEREQEETYSKCSSYLKNNANKIKCFSDLDDKELKEVVSDLYDYFRRSKSNALWGGNKWELLTPYFGEQVAENFRDGCIACWRKYNPKNIFSRFELHVALTGIAMEARFVADWTKHLSREKARQATHFAVLESSHLPYWLSDLQGAFPKEVKETLIMQLDNFLLQDYFNNIRTIVSTGSYFFYKKLDYQAALIDILAKHIDSEDQESLREIVWLILNQPLSSQLKRRLSLLVQDLLLKNNEREVKEAWLIILFHLDADKGKSNLETWLNQQANNTLKKELISNLFEYTYKYYIQRSVNMNIHNDNKDYKRLESLEYLLPLAFQYVPLHADDDRFAEFGQYTPPPDKVENTERMRGKLLRLVENSTGEKAYNLLKNMAKNTSIPFYKDYLYWLALCNAEKDAAKQVGFTQWTEKNIPNFENDVLKAIHNEKGFINYEQLRNDLIAIASIETTSRNAIAKDDENETNDRFKNALLHKGYSVAAQPPGGDSQSGIKAGERDLVILNAKGVDESIIEAFVLKGFDRGKINTHYNKLIKCYDTVGCATNFILVYAKVEGFEDLWGKYLSHEKFNKFVDTKNDYSKKKYIRIGVSKERSMEIYHLFINFYSCGKVQKDLDRLADSLKKHGISEAVIDEVQKDLKRFVDILKKHDVKIKKGVINKVQKDLDLLADSLKKYGVSEAVINEVLVDMVQE